MSNTNLALFRIPGCPYCIRVENTLERLGVQVELRDITRSPEHLRELLDARGRRTTPVLRIERGGELTYLPESADIIAWLREHHG